MLRYFGDCELELSSLKIIKSPQLSDEMKASSNLMETSLRDNNKNSTPIRCWASAFLSLALLGGVSGTSQDILAKTALIDDLQVARCESACLSDLEHRHRNNSEVRRRLRHHISAVCTEDTACASCVRPCRAETPPKRAECTARICSVASDVSRCQESCAFIERIHYSKPGACPATVDISNLECSASCDVDGDCAETQKCCTVGCSRICRAPALSDERLLPIPDGITIQERKRKRSAIVRWIMKRMAPAHVATNANIFVIQWRWSVHPDGDTMTPWQTITMRNKMYAILKHILAPGRFYTFRVAAVNAYGSYGYSSPSGSPFKLSRSVKAPSAPINLTVTALRLDPQTGDLVPTLSWQPPRSDLPLKEYQLSWWLAPNATATARLAKRRLRHRSADALPSDYEGDDVADGIELLPPAAAGSTRRRVGYGISGDSGKAMERAELRATLLPSYSDSAELRPFVVGRPYIVELYASIDSSDGELRGEPAFLHIPADIAIRFVAEPTASAAAIVAEKIVTESRKIFSENQDDIPMRDVAGQPTRFFGVGVEPTPTKTPPFSQNVDWDEHRGVELKTPYYERSGLKTALSWLHHPSCATSPPPITAGVAPQPRFRVRIRSNGECMNELPPQEFRVDFCVANFENLQFECQYIVEVTVTSTGRTITKTKFTTASCENTPSAANLKCPPWSKRPTPAFAPPMEMTTTTADGKPTTSISTITTTVATTSFIASSAVVVICAPTSALAAVCSWRPSEDTVGALVGYRIILTADTGTGDKNATASPFVSVVGAEERRIQLQSLLPATAYRFRVQPLTVHGLGAELFQTHFRTPAWVPSHVNATTMVATTVRQPILPSFSHTVGEGALSLFQGSRSGVPTKTYSHLEYIVFLTVAIILSTRSVAKLLTA